jgi:hypothetical protein
MSKKPRTGNSVTVKQPSPKSRCRPKFCIRHHVGVGEYPIKPQRLGAAEPQPKCERPLNRRDAMSAEKTAGEKTLLELRDSGLLHCDERRDIPDSVN